MNIWHCPAEALPALSWRDQISVNPTRQTVIWGQRQGANLQRQQWQI